MRWLLLCISLLASLLGAAQANSEHRKVLRKAIDVNVPTRPESYIADWQEETQINPQNAGAWLNYYIWSERSTSLPAAEKTRQLTRLVADARKHISSTAEYQLLVFFQSGKKDSTSIFKAVSLNRGNTEVFTYAIQYMFYAGKQKDSRLDNWCRQLENSKPLEQSFYEYHYNTLMSADSNAVLYAKGLGDLVPLAVLQNVYGIRKDISLRYFTGNTTAAANNYLCLSTGAAAMTKYPESIYTGLLIKLSGGESSELQENVERFKFTYLESVSYLPYDVAIMYKNYLPGFILLYRHYKNNGDNKAERIKTSILKIANSAGVITEINKALEK